MCINDNLRCAFVKSGSTLVVALVIVVIGASTPGGHAVAQVTMQPIEMQGNEIQNIEMQNNEIRNIEMQNNELQQNEIRNIELEQNRQSEFNPSEINPTEIKPTDINASEINPTPINASEINPTQIKATEINPTEIKPTEITPMQDDFFVKKGEPPAPAGAEEAAVANVPAGAAAGPHVGALILVGGAAVAGAAALAVGMSTATSSVDCGPAPQGFGGVWFSQYADWCSCMGGTASTANGVECIR